MKPILQIEYFFEKVYKAAETSKALALGKDGSWAATWGMASSSDAAEQAIRDCQNAYAREFPDSGNDDGCKIVAIDEEVKVPEAVDSGQWQKALSGEDKPFQAGIHMTQTRGGKPRGVVLAVHGCDGVGSELFNEAWGKYFNALGFDYHAPDSFADERPKAVCGEYLKHGRQMVSDVLRLRQGQTLRTIGLLKEKYPGLRLYLWGHSEGGAVVQSLDADVAGIMVSGEECGFWEQPVGAPESVPFLYFLGANDPYIDWSLLSESGKDMKKCQKRMGRHDWRLVVVQDNSHLVFPWRQEAQEAVAEFLGVEWHGVNPPIVDPKLIHNAKLTTSVAQYSSQPEHRALAYGPNGAFFWYSGWENAEDVAQAALFSCASQLGSNVFMSGNHLCALLDVDGKEHRAAAN